jgi:YbbR domain-containing protein
MGYGVSNITVDPNQVAVTGPAGTLARLRKVSTSPIDISGLRSTQSFEVEVQLPSGVKSETRQKVRVRVEIVPKPVAPTASPSVSGP